MSTIRVIGLLKINPGRFEEFKAFAAELAAVVHSKEQGANLYYEHYLDLKNETCLVAEAFVDADSFAAHTTNAGPIAQKGVGLFEPVSISILGDIGKAAAEKMSADYGAVLKLYPTQL